jgi:cob(I)alamin adenosyltransferase
MAEDDAFGKVHVITGSGKGKTTAAFGLALRAAGHGYHVCIVQFMKAGGDSGELISVSRLGNIVVEQFGPGGFADPTSPSEADREAAVKALAYAKAKLASGEFQLVVLDEVNVAAAIGLVSVDAVLEAVAARAPGVEVVMTGRNAPSRFSELADYVSEIVSRKHPFESGRSARKGIEW